jgi:hypothetical protein
MLYVASGDNEVLAVKTNIIVVIWKQLGAMAEKPQAEFTPSHWNCHDNSRHCTKRVREKSTMLRDPMDGSGVEVLRVFPPPLSARDGDGPAEVTGNIIRSPTARQTLATFGRTADNYEHGTVRRL